MTQPGKIGVLTFHRCINYGSYWQARCLVEGLRNRGRDAVLLDHRSRRVDLAEWRCALTPHRPAGTPAPDRAAYALKTRRFIEAIDALPRSPAFELEGAEPIDAYDLVLVGSDEVWNLRHPWYGGQRLFYGDGLRARRLASYAASFGNQAADEGLEPTLARLLARFDAISVRDDNSRRLVRAALGGDPVLVLDPCLMFPEVAIRRGPSGDADFVLVYGHSFPPWFQSQVRAWAQARGVRLVSFGYRNDWTDEHWLDAGPEAFPERVGAAAAVATTFFHGCVFALLHGKPFVCTTSDYRANKVRSLVSQLGAESRLVHAATPAGGYAAALDDPLGPSVHHRIAELRTRSQAFLDHALG